VLSGQVKASIAPLTDSEDGVKQISAVVSKNKEVAPVVTVDALMQTVVVVDKFDFLSTKRSDLLFIASKPYTDCYEEESHHQKLKSLMQKTRKDAETTLYNGVVEILSRKTLSWFGDKHIKFVSDQLKPKFDNIEKDHPKHGYFHAFFSRALKDHTLVEDIALASEYLYQVVKDQGGGTVLFLGRSPCVVQVAYEELLKLEKDEQQKLIHLNFSGHPDALTKRESNSYSTKTNIARNIVTPEKLRHYFSYLESKGLLQAKKLFIVDLIGSGGGLNSFLRILNSFYQNRDTQMPQLGFLNLSADIDWGMDRSQFFTFKQSGAMKNHGVMILPEDNAKNMKHFEIEAWTIPLFDKVLTELLDQDMFQEFCVHGIHYPAQRWTPEFDQKREQGGEYTNMLYAYLRLNFCNMIKYHHDKLKK